MSSLLNPFRIAGRGVLATALGIALIVPSPALASGEDVWSECVNNGSVSTNHSSADFRDALTNPPADGAEYTDCLSVIGAAQKRAAVGGGSANSGGSAGTGPGASAAGTGGGSGAIASDATQTVAPEALKSALAEKGIDPAAPAGSPTQAPAPAVVGGERIDLSSDRLPSIASAFSLPLPLAASAVVVLFSAALPLIRFAVGRFGSAPTGMPRAR